MFDWDPLVWIFMGLIAILLFGTILGSVIYIWLAAGPIFVKVVWTVACIILTLIIILASIVVMD